jgi:hypothetical protein
MSRPGQWFHDREHGRVVYWPFPGEDVTTMEALISTRETLVRINGATNVALRRLEFGITTVPRTTGGFGGEGYSGAIEIQNAVDVRLENVKICDTTGHAIKTKSSITQLSIIGCDISNCGAGGIYIRGNKNVISNCVIHDVGLVFSSAIGINAGGRDSVISHNTVYSVPYTGIAVRGQRLNVDYNLIYDCMNVLHDGAALYLTSAEDITVSHNLVRDIGGTNGYGRSSYYLDELTQNCTLASNVSFNVVHPCFNHMATNNIVRNNVFYNDGIMKISFNRSSGYIFESNIFQATGLIQIGGSTAVSRWHKNVMFSDAWKQVITDSSRLPGDTLYAEPMFNDISRLDFSFKTNSVIPGLGLGPVDVSRVGPQPLNNGQ